MVVKGGKMTEEHKRNIGLAHKGRKLSEEHKKKISITRHERNIPSSRKGVTLSDETKRKLSLSLKGKIPWNKGIPRTDIEKKAISKALETTQLRGKDSPTWKGGISYYPKQATLRKNKQILLKKYPLCVRCFKKTQHFHHIDFSRDNHSVENLMPLCHSCHCKIHHRHSPRPRKNGMFMKIA